MPPGNDPRPQKRSWRDGASTPNKGAAGKQTWRQEASSGPKGPFLTRRGKILLASGGLLAVLGTIIAVYLWLRPIDPPRLVLIGAGYETHLPVPQNVYGHRSLDDLADWAKKNKTWAGDKDKAVEIRQDDLNSEADAVSRALDGCTSKTVVVYLAVHGGADEKGAFLLPRDANPKDKDFGYRLDKVLLALGKLPEATKKLLILDVTQVPADWPLHMVHNDFARALEAEPKLDKVRNLVVLSASGPDQRSWVAEEFGRTAFGHFVVEGLKGAADQSGEGGKTSGVIDAAKLADFVKRRVEQWVRHNKGALQTPVLIDNDKIASKMELVIPDSNYTAPKPGQPAVPEKQLKAAWDEFVKLNEKTSPHPSVLAPHLWRLYQDTLFRYQELLLAGDESNADRLGKNLDRLGDQIRASKDVRRDAQSASLAMPAVLGIAAPETVGGQPLDTEFGKLWDKTDAKPEEFGKLIDGVADRTQRPAARLRVFGLLLDRAAQSEADLRRACDVFAKLEVGIEPRPAEVQFALLLSANLEKPLNGPQVQKALQLRRLAELAAVGLEDPSLKVGAAAYSEQVNRWIRADVLKGDEARVLGEDLLIATAKVVKGPDAYFADAEASYKEAQRKAKLVREALRVRDRGFAALPYYTRWQARQSFTDEDEKKKELAVLERRKVTAWEKLHELDAALAKPESGKVDALAAPAKAVDDELTALEKSFKASCAEPRSILQRHWHELNDLLAVPFIEPERRLQMIAKLREIETGLNATTDPKSTAGGMTEKQNWDSAREAAIRQARLALATLGPDAPEVNDLRAALKEPGEAWYRPLVRAGDRVGDAIRRLGEEAAESVAAGRKAKPAAAREPLDRAARDARLLDGASVESWLLAHDPVDEDRRVRLHDLLVGQADRAWRDYTALFPPEGVKADAPWDDPAKPYYRTAGGLFLTTAADLITGNRADLAKEEREGRLVEVNAEQAKLNVPDRFAIEWRDGDTFRDKQTTLHITDEKSMRRVYGLRAAEGAPPGFPVVWERPGARLLAPEKPERIALKVDTDPAGASVPFEIRPDRMRTPDGPREESSQVVVGFYRGRRFEMASPVVLHHKPDWTGILPQMPPTARISVQMSQALYNKFAADNCHLVIVLDCSGSMDSPNNTEPPPKVRKESRMDRALAALEKTVARLPAGVTLSLYTFSAKGEPEGRVTQRWNRERWTGKKEMLKDLMAAVKVTPYGETPLISAIIQASKLGFEKDAPDSARTMLVITDGADNYFHRKNVPAHGDGETMTDVFKRVFGNTRIQVNVIGFELELDDAADKASQREFEAAVTKGIGGNYFLAENSEKLIAALERSLLRVRFWIEERSGKVEPGKIPDDGVDVGLTGRDPRWILGLDAGTYNVALQTSLKRKGLEQQIRLDRGDSLLMELTEVGNEFRFVRRSFLDTHAELNLVAARAQPEGFRPPPGGPTGWHLGVVQNQRVGKDGLQLMTTIEKDLGPLKPLDQLRVARPRWAIFSVASSKEPGKPVSGLRFYSLAGYPAPAWSLDFESGWPSKSEPLLSAYWADEDYPTAAFTLKQGTHYKTLEDLRDKPVAADVSETEHTTVVVESVTTERRQVEVRPGQQRKDVDCVVVRLRYPDGTKPFLARLPDEVRPSGEEHMFYVEAGKYTGVFWDVSQETAEKMTSLRLVSIEEAKRNANKVIGLKLGDPGKTARPDPPRD
jgi:hypothetical protein